MPTDRTATAASWRYTLSIEYAMKCQMCLHLEHRPGPCGWCQHGHDEEANRE